MGHGGIDGDDQIQVGYGCSRIGEISEFGTPIAKRQSGRHIRIVDLIGSGAFLEPDQVDTFDLSEPGQIAQATRSFRIGIAAGPDEPDIDAFSRQPCAPLFHLVLGSGQIGFGE